REEGDAAQRARDRQDGERGAAVRHDAAGRRRRIPGGTGQADAVDGRAAAAGGARREVAGAYPKAAGQARAGRETAGAYREAAGQEPVTRSTRAFSATLCPLAVDARAHPRSVVGLQGVDGAALS